MSEIPQNVLDAFEALVEVNQFSKDAAIVETTEKVDGITVWVVLDHTGDELLDFFTGSDVAPVGVMNNNAIYTPGDYGDIVRETNEPTDDAPLYQHGAGYLDAEVSA